VSQLGTTKKLIVSITGIRAVNHRSGCSLCRREKKFSCGQLGFDLRAGRGTTVVWNLWSRPLWLKRICLTRLRVRVRSHHLPIR